MDGKDKARRDRVVSLSNALHYQKEKDEDTENILAFFKIEEWIDALRRYAKEIVPRKWTLDDFRRVFLVIKQNAFTLSAHKNDPSVVMSIFPRLSLLNHSCDPNCTIVNDFRGGPNTVLVALRSIKAGEELTIAYNKPYTRVSMRQLNLKCNYFFTCHCQVCRRELQPGFKESSWDVTEGPWKRFDRIKKETEGSKYIHYELYEAGVELLNAALHLNSAKGLSWEQMCHVIDTLVDNETGELKYVQSSYARDIYMNPTLATYIAHKIGRKKLAKVMARKYLRLILALNPDPNREALDSIVSLFIIMTIK